jgi:type II secretory pathway pseudopilin PulG
MDGAMKRVMKRAFKHTGGMSLVEVVVAFSIVTIVSVVLVLGFQSMVNILLRGDQVSLNDQRMAQDIALDQDGSYTTAAGITGIAVTDGVRNWQIPGRVRAYEQDGRIFQVFVVD